MRLLDGFEYFVFRVDYNIGIDKRFERWECFIRWFDWVKIGEESFIGRVKSMNKDSGGKKVRVGIEIILMFIGKEVKNGRRFKIFSFFIERGG